MVSFKQYLYEMWNEPDDSTFTDAGNQYDLNGLLSATLGKPIQQIPISKLTWILKWVNTNSKEDFERIKDADLSTPILIVQHGSKLVVVDGIHRLIKVQKENKSTIKTILVSPELLDRYKI